MPTKPNTTVKPTVAINVQLPEAVHKRLRMKAITEEMTLAEAVTAAIRAWTAK